MNTVKQTIPEPHPGEILLEEYSERKGQSLEETERWLAPNRGY